MAEAKKKQTPAKKQTVRERTKAAQNKRPPRLRRTAGKAKAPLRIVGKAAKKLRIPLPNNRFGRIVRKIGRILGRIFLPIFLRNAWAELRQVTWPGRRETWRLTMSVFIFALIFASFVGLLDFGLDKLFKEIIVTE